MDTQVPPYIICLNIYSSVLRICFDPHWLKHTAAFNLHCFLHQIHLSPSWFIKIYSIKKSCSFSWNTTTTCTIHCNAVSGSHMYPHTCCMLCPRRPLHAKPMHNYDRLQLKEAHKEKAENRIENIARKNKSAIMSLTLRMVHFCCKFKYSCTYFYTYDEWL